MWWIPGLSSALDSRYGRTDLASVPHPRLTPLVVAAHAQIAARNEALTLAYQPQVRQSFAVELAQSRSRERSQRLTLVGPHRDELQVLVEDRPAARFGAQ